MLSKEVSCQLRYPDYWERSYSQWRVDTWNQFFCKKVPGTTKQMSCDALVKELEILINNLKPRSKEIRKASWLKRELKVLRLLIPEEEPVMRILLTTYYVEA
ncbi:2904_t:CDS:2 [Acaulospora morrowiae]|uniref:2904_t:CDS:1 n=1 Tax=Acaulospora morrowiae TaxID=94023 RepID=A0A9N9G8I5_9GLOM|nr:2904_t:CDS:2 [Acaulospora morrowiae]